MRLWHLFALVACCAVAFKIHSCHREFERLNRELCNQESRIRNGIIGAYQSGHGPGPPRYLLHLDDFTESGVVQVDEATFKEALRLHYSTDERIVFENGKPMIDNHYYRDRPNWYGEPCTWWLRERRESDWSFGVDHPLTEETR